MKQSPNMLGGKKYEERSTSKQSPIPPSPTVLPVPRSRARRHYVYQSRCAVGGEELTETNAWEHDRWVMAPSGVVGYVRKCELLCTVHAQQQRARYQGEG